MIKILNQLFYSTALGNVHVFLDRQSLQVRVKRFFCHRQFVVTHEIAIEDGGLVEEVLKSCPPQSLDLLPMVLCKMSEK